MKISIRRLNGTSFCEVKLEVDNSIINIGLLDKNEMAELSRKLSAASDELNEVCEKYI